jgi:hypothetical protein
MEPCRENGFVVLLQVFFWYKQVNLFPKGVSYCKKGFVTLTPGLHFSVSEAFSFTLELKKIGKTIKNLKIYFL